MTPEQQAEAARSAADAAAQAEQLRRQMEAELQRHGQDAWAATEQGAGR